MILITMTPRYSSFYFSCVSPGSFGKLALGTARGMSVDVYGFYFGLPIHQPVQQLKGHICQPARLRAVLRLLKTALGISSPKDAGTGTVSVTTFHYCTESTLAKAGKSGKQKNLECYKCVIFKQSLSKCIGSRYPY